MYLLILSILQFAIVIQTEETNNSEQEISDYCDAVAKDTSFKVNLTVSDIDNKNYCVEGGSRVALFDTIQQEDQYVYLSEHYCANLQHYPITCEQYYHASEYDQKAKANYKKLYEDYKATGVPNSDCLGIARYVFCAEQFKYCSSDDGNTDYEICSFLCVIWQNRCPDYSDIYDRVCANGGGENGICSYAINYTFLLFFILFLLS
ncbi:unnamed protein product [Paramecium octaurelia]|uniref:Transmembrane protein n=1 Tax=Paramecium octaurelia TaxID=43137 RepID=A0A8S1UEJ6_PAROT|nr:unnamed protein product [Paramecium octaurelia]